MRTYQFYATGTGNLGIQMLQAGFIYAATWSGLVGTLASGDGIVAELSMFGTTQVTTNNPSQSPFSIFNVRVGAATAASIAQTAFSFTDSGFWLPVKLGDVVYLNTVITNTASVRALLRVADPGERR